MNKKDPSHVYRIVSLPPNLINTKDPVYGDFGFKITDGKYKDLVFALSDVEIIDSEKDDSTLSVQYNIRYIEIPESLKKIKDQLLDGESNQAKLFQMNVSTKIVSNLFENAIQTAVDEHKEQLSNDASQ